MATTIRAVCRRRARAKRNAASPRRTARLHVHCSFRVQRKRFARWDETLKWLFDLISRLRRFFESGVETVAKSSRSASLSRRVPLNASCTIPTIKREVPIRNRRRSDSLLPCLASRVFDSESEASPDRYRTPRAPGGVAAVPRPDNIREFPAGLYEVRGSCGRGSRSVSRLLREFRALPPSTRRRLERNSRASTRYEVGLVERFCDDSESLCSSILDSNASKKASGDVSSTFVPTRRPSRRRPLPSSKSNRFCRPKDLEEGNGRRDVDARDANLFHNEGHRERTRINVRRVISIVRMSFNAKLKTAFIHEPIVMWSCAISLAGTERKRTDLAMRIQASR